MAVLLLLAVFANGAASEPPVFKLHPPETLEATVGEAEVHAPFTQAVPFGQGKLAPEDVRAVAVNGQPIAAATEILNYWPDGSVRMIRIEGVVPAELLGEHSLDASFVDESLEPSPRNPIHYVDAEADRLVFRDGEGQAIATLSLEAAWMPITEEKIIYPNEPEVNDEVAQYGWAHELEDLAEEAESDVLEPRMRECVIERETPVFTDYLARGDAGDSEPGNELEWQLHLRIYRAAPVVRWRMTWAVHWDPEDYALTRAAWVLQPEGGISSPAIPPSNDSNGTPRFEEEGMVRFEPNGEGVIEGRADNPMHVDQPSERWHRLLMQSNGRTLGLAVCGLSRLGPSHVSVDEQTLEVASWSDRFGLGMDLRSSAEPDEFGIGYGDLTADGRGAAFSIDGALVMTECEDEADALTAVEASRDHLWFPSARELYETGALQDRVHPETVGAGDERATRLRGTQESVYFLLLSRDYWRWYGALNYGDVRTNFMENQADPERGLYEDRWGLHGRYGWRNGSSDVHGRMLYFGLLLEDRDVILAALDYARHVADVDVKHASFFAEPEGDEGGMHRRNKDHWSGGVEPQYTTSRGLYLASWMTGNHRLDQVLAEVRAFTANVDRQASSAFRAEPWIHRYAETLDPEDLAVARRLLDACAETWGRREGAPEELEGLSVMYFDNFRRVGNGMLVLIDFHQNTGEQEYLDAILKSVRYHGVDSVDDSYLVAYMLANGMSAERIGEPLMEEARGRAPRQAADPNGKPKREWTYSWLRERIPSNRQSYNIGRVMRYQPLTLEVLGERRN
ncbi:MAG: hypothetical protein R6W89_10505 [Candidatus Hydrogenedentota bacterium]